MKALVQYGYGGAEVLRLEDRPVPEPGPREVRLRVLACGVNGSDWEFLRGVPYYAKLAGGSPMGRVLGSDICGVVDAVGDAVTGLAEGQVVAAETLGSFGGFAEYAVVKAALCVPVPDGLEPVVAAALPQSAAVAVSGMGDLVQAGQEVLINGAGGAAGPLAVRLAIATGARVTAVDQTSKLEMLRGLGADRVMDFRVQDFAAEEKAYDLILDLWGTRSVATVRRRLKPSGSYLIVGGPYGRVVEFGLWGMVLSLLTRRTSKLLLAPMGVARLPEFLQMGAEGRLVPVISDVVSLDGAAEAIARMGAGDLPGKLVIVP